MQELNTSRQLGKGVKVRSRRWRRVRVVWFYACIVLILAMTLGNDHHGLRHFTYATSPIVLAVVWCLRCNETQHLCRVRACEAAFRVLRRTLPWFAAAYWAVYLWMPTGGWRETLMDSPVLISWLAVFVISLPQAIEIWREPDRTGEPRAPASA